jgi:hypothetical protein
MIAPGFNAKESPMILQSYFTDSYPRLVSDNSKQAATNEPGQARAAMMVKILD